MKNKTIILLCLPLTLFFGQCKEEQLQQYQESPSVYFADFFTGDSLVHSLAGVSGDADTVFLNIKLLGEAFSADKQFKVQIDENYTTAKAGQHFEPLKDYYIFPANQYNVKIPVILFKSDGELNNKSFKLGLKIMQTEDLGLGYPGQLSAHLIFTSQLIMPAYWESYLKNYYGDYSKVKHEKCIEIQGFDFPQTQAEIDNDLRARLMSYGRVVCKYFIDNTVYDENGNKILPWSPL